MPKKFYIFKAEDVYKVAGNTKEDIWVSQPVGPFELTEADRKEEARLKKLIRKWRRESARRARS
jgi:hypothetical protein